LGISEKGEQARGLAFCISGDLLSRRYPKRFLVLALAPKYLILLARPERGDAQQQKALYLLENFDVLPCRWIPPNCTTAK